MYRKQRKVIKAPKGKMVKTVAGKITFVDKPKPRLKRNARRIQRTVRIRLVEGSVNCELNAAFVNSVF